MAEGMSASLWGCELKWLHKFNNKSRQPRQPPCEAVSWNSKSVGILLWTSCQPPCEAVSWNRLGGVAGVSASGSASLWGCELKWLYQFNNKSHKPVSLLVRLWVEIHLLIYIAYFSRSASLWGCELKWYGRRNIICRQLSASLWGCELK